jgi:ribosomal protein S18 acetylase RimI-like enzyme
LLLTHNCFFVESAEKDSTKITFFKKHRKSIEATVGAMSGVLLGFCLGFVSKRKWLQSKQHQNWLERDSFLSGETLYHCDVLPDDYRKLVSEGFAGCAKEHDVDSDFQTRSFVILDSNRKFVASVSAVVSHKSVQIYSLFVVPECRKKGYGRNLLETVENYYKNKGLSYMLLETYGYQAPSFYETSGFTKESTIKNGSKGLLDKHVFVKAFGKECLAG